MRLTDSANRRRVFRRRSRTAFSAGSFLGMGSFSFRSLKPSLRSFDHSVHTRLTGHRLSNPLREEWNRAAEKVSVRVKMYEGTKHTSATEALRGGRRREEIQKALGHRDRRSTERYAKLAGLIKQSYREFFQSIPCRSFMLFGNTDDPQVMRETSGDRVEIIESGVVEIEGVRFGMVSGSPEGPWTVGLPGEMKPDKYEGLVNSLGPVNVLCTHYPPAVPELTWDRLANRDEVGSEALLSFIDRYSPLVHYFGHVHNPRSWEAQRGSTRLVNAGFFKEHCTAIVHSNTS